jgi:hypothetical protein
MTPDANRDGDARIEAIDPRRSFIVQAPAGSGKTSLLTLRYLRLLATVSSPEEIVAITFTRKAASEMRHRILGALAAASRPLAADARPHERDLHALATAALAQSRARGWELERNPARLHVQTIDGLNHWLAQRLPLAARIGLSATLVDDARPLYREAARRLVNALESGDERAGPLMRLARAATACGAPGRHARDAGGLAAEAHGRAGSRAPARRHRWPPSRRAAVGTHARPGSHRGRGPGGAVRGAAHGRCGWRRGQSARPVGAVRILAAPRRWVSWRPRRDRPGRA